MNVSLSSEMTFVFKIKKNLEFKLRDGICRKYEIYQYAFRSESLKGDHMKSVKDLICRCENVTEREIQSVSIIRVGFIEQGHLDIDSESLLKADFNDTFYRVESKGLD